MRSHSLYKFDGIIVLDTETTGLDWRNDRIIELAAIMLRKRDGSPEWAKEAEMDDLIRLPDGQTLPPKIIELTGITDEMLRGGYSEKLTASCFRRMIRDGGTNVLLVAYNAQFDILFLNKLLTEPPHVNLNYLDAKTVFMDRAMHPHRLSDAITHYDLDGKVQNTHRALDDAQALLYVLDAMARERDNLLSYVNLFGYHPIHGIYGEPVEGIEYLPQPCGLPASVDFEILPVKARKRREASPFGIDKNAPHTYY